MKRLGIDIGSLSVGCVLLDDGGGVAAAAYRPHRGDIEGSLKALLADPAFSVFDLAGVAGPAASAGSPTIDPALSVIEGARHLLPGCRNALSAGGQTFSLIFYDARGEYREHTVNPPCASGTGSFLEQQAERLGLGVEELARRAERFEGKIPGIATRCAVFAKTDIIHAMQEGHSVDAVCAGLCDGIARNLLDVLVKGRPLGDPLGFVGGVALNSRIAGAIGRIAGVRVAVPPHGHLAGAVGAALLATGRPPGVERCFERASGRSRQRPPLTIELSSPPDLAGFSIDEREGVESFLPKRGPAEPERRGPGPARTFTGAFAGIDIGSTSTKIALVDERAGFLGGFYTATGGDPVGALERLVREIERTFEVRAAGEARGGDRPGSRAIGARSVEILGVATTGSGRKLVKDLFLADMEVDEITAHAKAAVFLHPDVDTIIEIGGQDSKFTRLRDGEVYFSAMNYACAAGTGSFIEEQAKRLGVGLGEFSSMAFGAPAPYTSDRCTVYMERDLGVLLCEGWPKSSLAAAVLHSVRDNYLAKVVGKSPLGDRVVFQGATARNRALVASFEQLLKKPILVSPYCHLTGAFGAALLCREAGRADAPPPGAAALPRETVGGAPKSTFLWGAFAGEGRVAIERETCTLCPNRCLLTVASSGGGKSAWGMKCGREYESRSMRKPGEAAPSRRFRNAMAPLVPKRPVPARGRDGVVIGLSPALYGAEYLPLWRSFLEELGFRVAVAEPGRKALESGKGLVNSEFCAPMIAAHGSIKALLDRGVDYVFFPAMMNEEDERGGEPRLFRKKTRDAYFCYYSQYFPTVVSNLTGVELEGKLISPLLAPNGKTAEEVAREVHAELGRRFPDLAEEETLKAYVGAHGRFRERRAAFSRGFEAGTAGADAAPSPAGARTRVVILGRPYVTFDPDLNLGIPLKLEALGADVFWQDEFALEGEPLRYADRYFERMHWHFGKKIVRTAEYCAGTPNLFAVFLTCFRCSPDSFLMSYVKDIMDRCGKPFLILQTDEHTSDVGFTTRLEAALRTFNAYRGKHEGAPAGRTLSERTPSARTPSARTPSARTPSARTPSEGLESAGAGPTDRMPPAPRPGGRNDRLEKGDTVLVPYIDRLISRFWADSFIRAGYDALVLDADEKALSTGYRFASGGECMPLVSIMGGVVEKVRSEGLDPAKTFFFLPTSCYACNFPQFPILSGLAFRSAGLDGLKVGLLNVMSLGEGLSQSLAARILESNIAASVLYKVESRVKPYETRKGETEAALLAAKDEIGEAIREGRDVRAALASAIERFRRIERDETRGRKARIAVIGDLYVKYSEAVNQGLKEFIESLGGELVIPSVTEYALHYYFADMKHFGDDPRHYTLLRSIERRYEKLAADIIGDQLEPDLAECASLMEERRLGHYIVGETSINVGRALHEIVRAHVDAVVHVNPIFCCPGVVSASIFRKVQEELGVPVVDLFYDGTGNPNSLLVPHLHYLMRKGGR